MNNTSVESYLADGCGRCDRFATPECTVHQWPELLAALRDLMRETPLDETMKWGAPCYTLNGKTVAMISARKTFCALSFFKGAALDDPEKVLVKPGPNSRYARYLKFDSLADFDANRASTDDMLARAIQAERDGVTVQVDKTLEPLPDELADRLAADEEVAAAFEGLTRGRKRSYILHIGGAKKAETRLRRVEKCVPKMMAGKGFNER